MSDASRATAAKVPLKLGEITLQISPMTDRDIAELDEWVQWRYLQNVRDSFRPTDRPEVREMETRVAQENSLSLTWLSGRGARIIATLAGMSRIVWQACHRNHPDMTEEKIRTLLIDKANLDAANAAFEKANKPPPAGVSSPNAEAVSVAN